MQYLWYLLAALALGVLVGWLWWGRRLKRSVEVTQDVQRQLTSAKAGADQLAEEHEATKRQLVSVGDVSKQHGDAMARIGELEAALAASRSESTDRSAQLAAAAKRLQDQDAALAGSGTRLQDREAALSAAMKRAQDAEAAHAAATKRAQDAEAALAAATAKVDDHAARFAALRADHDQLTEAHTELQGVSRFVLPPLAERVPAGDRRDDLTVVEGIGPKMAEALQAGGIHTFDQLSNATEAELHAAIEASNLSFAPSIPTWSKQAALLARGDRDGFAAYTAWLVAGVPPTDGSPDPLGPASGRRTASWPWPAPRPPGPRRRRSCSATVPTTSRSSRASARRCRPRCTPPASTPSPR